MAISHPRFVGPYGTGDGEHDGLYYQREVKEFMNEVLSGIEVDDGRAQGSSLSCLLTRLSDDTKRLHGLFNSSEGWYRKMATDICKELRIPPGTSSGSDVMDGLRATLAAYVVPHSQSQLIPAREGTYFYRLLLTKLQWLIKNAATPSRIADVLKHAFLDYALAMFHGKYQVFRVAELAQLMQAVKSGSSISINEGPAGSGQQTTTQNEVLGAARSFINAIHECLG